MYRLGIDLGITSVGYSVLETNMQGEPIRIITAGSRIFDAAENPKDGSSLALPRREARAARRRSRRRVHRLDRIKSLMERKNIITKSQLEKLYNRGGLSDIYKVRYEALQRRLSREEFARLLVHLAKRRGFKSTYKEIATNKEIGQVYTCALINEELMIKNAYRTVGEMLYKDEKFLLAKRNKSERYNNAVSRDMIAKEMGIIFQLQRSFKNPYADSDFEKEYTDIALCQRSFEEGPGGESKYAGNQIEKMIGRCSFEKDEPRAVKASYTAEMFILMQKVNNINIIDGLARSRALTDIERHLIIAAAHSVSELKYSRIRKLLALADEERFNMLTYDGRDVCEVEKSPFEFLKAYHRMKKAFSVLSKNYIEQISISDRDEIARIFTVFKSENSLREELLKTGLTHEEIEACLALSPFRNVAHLSVKAMRKINPFLEKGYKYSKACELAGYDFKAHCGIVKNKFLPPLPPDLPEITSPVVKRAISQAIKVINKIIAIYGSPAIVCIEVGREVSKSFSERKKMEKEQEENRRNNEKEKEFLRKEFGVISPTVTDIIRLRLFREQGGICPYTNTALALERIFEVGYCDIDHILPYSLTFDDSYNNKVLVRTHANREKGNRLPLDYLSDKERFKLWVNSNVKNKNKRDKLLKERLSEEDFLKARERNLNDTKQITKFMLNYINDNLLFDATYSGKKKVKSVSGRITAYMRRRWGISKIRENGDLHHAVDAVVISCISEGTIQRVTKYLNACETKYSTNNKDAMPLHSPFFPEPWQGFRREVEYRFSENPSELLIKYPLQSYSEVDISKIKPFFVSRMKRKKLTGSAHKETIMSKTLSGYVKKVPLTSLRLNKNADAIENYYNPQDDRLLYELLLNKLISANGDAVKAFEEPVYKPTPCGGTAPLVKKVKITEKMSLGVEVNSGIASNGDMLRIDLYHVEGEGYYFIPIYAADMIKPTLPTKACVATKPFEQWREMEEENFLFSLYPNDLIKITAKKPIKLAATFKSSTLSKVKSLNEGLFYYRGADIFTASIAIISHDNAYTLRGKGIKKLLSIEKYAVDELGNYQICGREKRGQSLKKKR